MSFFIFFIFFGTPPQNVRLQGKAEKTTALIRWAGERIGTMLSNETHARKMVGKRRVATVDRPGTDLCAVEEIEMDGTLDRALALLEEGRPLSADSLLTWALIEDGDNCELWMAAGLARLQRGAIAAARSAFTMSAWISGDPLAVELAGVGLQGR